MNGSLDIAAVLIDASLIAGSPDSPQLPSTSAVPVLLLADVREELSLAEELPYLGLVPKNVGASFLLHSVKAAVGAWESLGSAVDREVDYRGSLDGAAHPVVETADIVEYETKYRALVETAADAIMILEGGRFVECNRAAVTLFGAENPSQIVGKEPPLLSPETQADGTRSHEKAERLVRLALDGAPQHFEWTHRRMDGTLFDAQVSLTAVALEQQTYILAIVRDVTEVNRVHRELRRAIDERDALMQELNHRVKNNLAMVGSLLSLKDRVLGDIADLSDIRAQLDAIRAVHERLSRSSGTVDVEMRSYLSQLVATVFGAVSGPPVSTTVDCAVGSFPAKVAVPVGLIVNEIATNALKHAYADSVAREFRVELRSDEDSYTLVLSNSGAPFPDIDIRMPTTLGLQLVVGLVDQLGGSLELLRTPHPEFTVRFPASAVRG